MRKCGYKIMNRFVILTLDFEISDEDMIELIKLNEINYGKDSFWPVFNKKNRAK